MRPCEVWIGQREVARRIEDDFGTDKALDYLVRKKFVMPPGSGSTPPHGWTTEADERGAIPRSYGSA